jgi:hypothetical protein
MIYEYYFIEETLLDAEGTEKKRNKELNLKLIA